MQGDIHRNALVIRDFNIPLSVQNRLVGPKIKKDTEDLNNNQLVELMVIYCAYSVIIKNIPSYQ